MTSIEKLKALHENEIGFSIVNGRKFGYGAHYPDRTTKRIKTVSSDDLDLCIDRLWIACKEEYPQLRMVEMRRKPN